MKTWGEVARRQIAKQLEMKKRENLADEVVKRIRTVNTTLLRDESKKWYEHSDSQATQKASEKSQ